MSINFSEIEIAQGVGPDNFRAKKAENNTPVLMSKENPTGWKLEDLLVQLQKELMHKTLNIISDSSATALLVRNNNINIIDLINKAEVLQRDSYSQLAKLRADAGPMGKPRIGQPNEVETDDVQIPSIYNNERAIADLISLIQSQRPGTVIHPGNNKPIEQHASFLVAKKWLSQGVKQ